MLWWMVEEVQPKKAEEDSDGRSIEDPVPLDGESNASVYLNRKETYRVRSLCRKPAADGTDQHVETDPRHPAHVSRA
jgi:hypothetical protein